MFAVAPGPRLSLGNPGVVERLAIRMPCKLLVEARAVDGFTTVATRVDREHAQRGILAAALRHAIGDVVAVGRRCIPVDGATGRGRIDEHAFAAEASRRACKARPSAPTEAAQVEDRFAFELERGDRACPSRELADAREERRAPRNGREARARFASWSRKKACVSGRAASSRRRNGIRDGHAVDHVGRASATREARARRSNAKRREAAFMNCANCSAARRA
jgi:hypothetical protein